MNEQITPVSFRFTAEKKAALEKAAAEDSRSMSSLIDKVLTEWLKSNSYIKAKAGKR
jgi:hypothetical protein